MEVNCATEMTKWPNYVMLVKWVTLQSLTIVWIKLLLIIIYFLHYFCSFAFHLPLIKWSRQLNILMKCVELLRNEIQTWNLEERNIQVMTVSFIRVKKFYLSVMYQNYSSGSHSCYVWCHKKGGGFMTQGWKLPDGTPCGRETYRRSLSSANRFCVNGACRAFDCDGINHEKSETEACSVPFTGKLENLKKNLLQKWFDFVYNDLLLMRSRFWHFELLNWFILLLCFLLLLTIYRNSKQWVNRWNRGQMRRLSWKVQMFGVPGCLWHLVTFPASLMDEE